MHAFRTLHTKLTKEVALKSGQWRVALFVFGALDMLNIASLMMLIFHFKDGRGFVDNFGEKVFLYSKLLVALVLLSLQVLPMALFNGDAQRLPKSILEESVTQDGSNDVPNLMIANLLSFCPIRIKIGGVFSLTPGELLLMLITNISGLLFKEACDWASKS